VNLRGVVLLAVSLFAAFVVGSAEGPQYGGTFRIAADEASNLNPILLTDGPSAIVADRIYETLVVYEPGLKRILPNLAVSWDNPDDRTWVFKLRDDVRWHDSTKFTAEDVKYTFELVLDPDTHAARRQNFSLIESVEVIDPYTVKFVLSRPSPFFLDDLALLGYIICKDYTERVGLEVTIRQPMGTGPFKFAEWVPGEYIRLVANENYWGGRPYLDEVIYKVIPESAVQLAALEAGEVDYIGGTMAAVEMVKANPYLRVIELPSVIWNHIGFNLKQERFQDVRVRRAFYNALDRQGIADAVFYGYGYVGNSPIPKSHAMYFDPAVAEKYAVEYAHDPEKAKALLAEAGWADTDGDGIVDKDGEPFEVTLLGVSGGVELEQIAVIAKDQLAEVGIKVNIQNVEIGTWLDRVFAGEFDTCLIQFGVGFTPALQEQYFHSGGPFNIWGYSNPLIDQLLDEGKSTMDEAKRKEIYSRYQEEFMRDAPVVLICTWPRFIFLSRRVHGMSDLDLGQLELLHKVWVEEG